MGLVLRFVFIALALGLLYRAVRGMLPGSSRSGLPCASCRNCKALFDDGAICLYGGKETFKNEVHIAHCTDYRRGRAG